MMKEIPAIQDMMDKRPELAMKEISQMMKAMSDLMAQMGQMMTEISK